MSSLLPMRLLIDLRQVDIHANKKHLLNKEIYKA